MTHRLPLPTSRVTTSWAKACALATALATTLSACAPIGPRQHDAPVDPSVCSAGLGPEDNTRLAAIEQAAAVLDSAARHDPAGA